MVVLKGQVITRVGFSPPEFTAHPRGAGHSAFPGLPEDELDVLVHAEPQDGDQLPNVFDAPSDDRVTVVRLPLVENRFQPGQHDRALSWRQVGAAVVWMVEQWRQRVETLRHWRSPPNPFISVRVNPSA